ncbi:glutathione S-transferase [Xylariomycetidae sp. FL2044]|nr:glutathione S-transferase [Xylariomycetidae sp. FL2044]
MATVDTSLPAHPTGAAAKFAAAHADEHPLKLYGGWFCPFVQRSWIVLHEKQIMHQYVEINPYKKEPEFLALNPRGLVPTLAVPTANPNGGGGGRGDQTIIGKTMTMAAAAGTSSTMMTQKPLYESVVICEYLDEAYPKMLFPEDELYPKKKKLFPEEAYERARCRLWIDHVGNKIVPAFYRFIQHTPEKDYSLEQARDNLLTHIKTFAREMHNSGPWFLGDRFSMVDIMLAPWAKRLFLIDHYKPGGVGIPQRDGQGEGEGEGEGNDDDDAGVWDRWRVWFDAITTRRSVLDTWSDDEMYIQAYKRYAEDTTNSEVGQATRKGEKLP